MPPSNPHKNTPDGGVKSFERNPMSRLYSPVELSSPGSSSSFTKMNSPKSPKNATSTVFNMDSVTEERIQAAIQNALDHYMYDSAVFLAESLYAFRPDPQNLFLITTCYYRNKETLKAYHFLKTHFPTNLKNSLETLSSSEVSIEN
jgi:hypothetical protein